MDVKTESDINGAVALSLRSGRGESQEVFWGRIGVTQAGGCRYERGRNIPRPVRLLVFASYVAGIPLDSRKEEGGALVKYIGQQWKQIATSRNHLFEGGAL
jgi:transcriptional regulator with XRE-family HTH domain